MSKYKAEPGKFLLVEAYIGSADTLYPVETHEAGDALTTERLNYYTRSGTEGYASWHLFDDQGNELPPLKKVA